jgi:hypothetical protein
VLTPGGNWSSYPPHKHDEQRPGESELEEIYYFEVAPFAPAAPGIGYQRVYGTRTARSTCSPRCAPATWCCPARLARPVDGRARLRPLLPQRDGRPRPERAWLICDDPAHGWVRGTWADQPVDPRGCRLTSEDRRRRPTRTRPTHRRPGLVRFLANQYTERDGVEQRLIAGCFGIFGHGNVAGSARRCCRPSRTGRGAAVPPGPQRAGMVHAAVGYARMRNRLQTLACTASIGPGSTNMVTGAALATVNRLPVLLLPSDVFATRVADPVLQELEDPRGYDVSVNDAFRPVSKYFDRVWRPEQLPVGAARRDAGAHRPGRDRRGHDRACRRTCRPRRTTGRTSCSPSGSGTSPARCPSRPRRAGAR